MTVVATAYCDDCFAFFGSLVHADLLSRAQIRRLSSDRVPIDWGRFCLVGGDLHHLWILHVLPFLEHLPHNRYSSADIGALSCSAFGRQAQLACMWRYLRLSPLLENTCLRFWTADQARMSREHHYETMEIILMFLQGHSGHVPRPLPAVPGLKSHGYL